MNIHKSQLFWCELQGYYWFWPIPRCSQKSSEKNRWLGQVRSPTAAAVEPPWLRGAVLGYPIKERTQMITVSDRINTSSTAQGGGGSFKNRKPIGEVGCCESGMAERSHWWTERCLISLTLSISFSDYLPTYLSIFYVSIYLSISLSLSFI